MRPSAYGALGGLMIVTVVLTALIVTGNAPSSQVSGEAHESPYGVLASLAGTEAACINPVRVPPLHEMVDGVNCTIDGVQTTVGVYASRDAIERELKAIGGVGVGRYAGFYVARLSGPTWMVATGSYNKDQAQLAAEAAQRVLGGEIDYSGW